MAAAALVACSGQNAPDASQWGARFATPGTRVDLTETSRTPPPTAGKGSVLIAYQVDASGLPPGKQYELWVKRSTDPTPRKFAALRLRPDGHSGATVLAHDFARGESIGVGVIATDGSVKAFGETYPYPLEARDGACHVALTLIARNGEAFGASAEGFPPSSPVEIT